MKNLDNTQVTKVMIALVGMNDPETEIGPTAPIIVYRQERPEIVFLMPTKDPERPSSYENAQKTQRRLEREGCKEVNIVPVSLAAAFDNPSRLFLAVSDILGEIEKQTRQHPNRRFVICPVSGLPRMRDALKTSLERKMIRNFDVYDVQLGHGGPTAIPIWSEIREPRVALFVDADAITGGMDEDTAKAIREAASRLGSIEEAWAFANWFLRSPKVMEYYGNGFRPVTLPVAPEITDINLFTFIGESLEYRDNDIYVIVSHDTRFHNGVAAILGHGREVHFWNPERSAFGILETVKELHPERLHLRYLAEVLSEQAEHPQATKTEERKLHGKPTKHAMVTSLTPEGILSTLCVIRLEQLSLKNITMHFSLDSLSKQPVQQSGQVYLIALSDLMATPAIWFRFLDKIRKTEGLAIRVINLSEVLDRNLPRRDPSWHLWSQPHLPSYGDLLRHCYSGRVEGDKLARLCVEALSAKRSSQANELLRRSRTAVDDGPPRVMAFLKALATGGYESLH